jgi:hypothetical protein
MLMGGAGLVLIGWLAGMPLESAFYLGILLACPLMMVFMMMGVHGGGHEHAQSTEGTDCASDRDREIR